MCERKPKEYYSVLVASSLPSSGSPGLRQPYFCGAHNASFVILNQGTQSTGQDCRAIGICGFTCDCPAGGDDPAEPQFVRSWTASHPPPESPEDGVRFAGDAICRQIGTTHLWILKYERASTPPSQRSTSQSRGDSVDHRNETKVRLFQARSMKTSGACVAGDSTPQHAHGLNS